MAFKLKRNILNIKNPNTGLYESVPMMVGESAYQIAVRHGYTGSEQDWIEHISGTSGGVVSEALKAKKAGALDLSAAVGGEKEPVYFNAEGKPVSCGLKMGSAAGYDASDDPNEKQNSVMTNIAMQKALEENIPELIQVKLDNQSSKFKPTYVADTETIVFNATSGTVVGETLILS